MVAPGAGWEIERNDAPLLAFLELLPAPGGILPVVWGLGAAIVGAVVGSLAEEAARARLKRPLPTAARERVMGPIEAVFDRP